MTDFSRTRSCRLIGLQSRISEVSRKTDDELSGRASDLQPSPDAHWHRNLSGPGG
jgi:hypothetical protein